MTLKDSSVQYAYGLDDHGALTHISDAQRSQIYTCPGCHSVLIPVLGEIKTKHYRHSEECCSAETYLHKCAKEAFFQCYQQALKGISPVVLELERAVHCQSPKTQWVAGRDYECRKMVPARYNMVTLFDRAGLEKRDSHTGLTPDVMLFQSEGDNRAYVEICVTHPCTPEKIASGIPIVEFKITSEYDLQMLLCGSYSVHDERVSLHNFRALSGTTAECTRPCPLDDIPMSTWSLSESGRLNERVVLLKDVYEGAYSELSAWPESLSEADKVNNLHRFLKYADPQNLYPNCLSCRRSSDWKDGYLMCSSKSRRVPYTEARQCADYRADT